MANTQVEVAIAYGASKLGSAAYNGRCQVFVRECYNAAGIYGSAESASEACAKWSCSTDMTSIPKGAAVYFVGSGSAGHVGIYTGDGNVLHAVNVVKIETISACNDKYIFRGWGWQGGVVPTGSNYEEKYKPNTVSKKENLGKFTITAYCPCAECCGKNDGITASGKTAKAGQTIAADTSVLPMGSKVQIEGKIYTVEDTGGAIKGKRIDIYFDTHEEALNYGKRYEDVYLINEVEPNILGDATSINLNKKTFDELPVFNKAAVSKLLGVDTNKGIKLYIINDNCKYDATDLCTDSIQLTTKRRATPAKLTFKIARDLAPGKLSFEEGNAVALIKDSEKMFFGYVFAKSRTKDNIIEVTAYDQTRYFKNKETYVYTKKASQLLQMIAADFRLQTGDITDTYYTITARVEDNVTLWDIIYNALDLTTIATGNMYILYDDFGELVLRSYDELALQDMIVSDIRNLIDFNYKTDIDTETYNRIVLYKDNSESGCRDVYIAQDSVNAMKWGVLQYTEKISDNYTESKISDIAYRLLKMQNKVHKTFSVEVNTGDARVRAGSSIYISIKDVGDSIDGMMLVDSCTHTMKNNEHTMQLELVGDIVG